MPQLGSLIDDRADVLDLVFVLEDVGVDLPPAHVLVGQLSDLLVDFVALRLPLLFLGQSCCQARGASCRRLLSQIVLRRISVVHDRLDDLLFVLISWLFLFFLQPLVLLALDEDDIERRHLVAHVVHLVLWQQDSGRQVTHPHPCVVIAFGDVLVVLDFVEAQLGGLAGHEMLQLLGLRSFDEFDGLLELELVAGIWSYLVLLHQVPDNLLMYSALLPFPFSLLHTLLRTDVFGGLNG